MRLLFRRLRNLGLTGVMVGTAVAGAMPAMAEDVSSGPGPTPAEVGQCWNVSKPDLWILTESTVDCTLPHTAETILVVEIANDDLSNPFSAAAVVAEKYRDSRGDVRSQSASGADRETLVRVEKLAAQAKEQCAAAKKEAAGLANDHRVTLYQVEYSGPNDEQWAAGQRWIRCNLVKYGPRAEGFVSLDPPAERDGEALRSQHCFRVVGRGTKNAPCVVNGKANEQAWVNLLDQVPLSQVTNKKPPRTDAKSWSLVKSYCYRNVTANLGKSLKPNWRSNIVAAARVPDGVFTWKSAWKDPGATINCAIPVWAYAPAVSQ